MKLNKRKKFGRMRGTRYCGWAAKKHKGSGNRGGCGMAGTGKRADHKKSLIIKLYGNSYFGKESMKPKKRIFEIIDLDQIEKNLETFIKKGIAKKTSGGIEINLEKYKVLGRGEVKNKLILKAGNISESAKEKIEKAGGKVSVKFEKVEEKKTKSD